MTVSVDAEEHPDPDASADADATAHSAANDRAAHTRRGLPNLDPLLHESSRLALLSLLAPAESVDFSALVRMLELSKSALSKHVTALSEAGIVDVTNSDTDRRARRISLSPTGREAFDAYLANLESIVRRARGGTT